MKTYNELTRQETEKANNYFYNMVVNSLLCEDTFLEELPEYITLLNVINQEMDQKETDDQTPWELVEFFHNKINEYPNLKNKLQQIATKLAQEAYYNSDPSQIVVDLFRM